MNKVQANPKKNSRKKKPLNNQLKRLKHRPTQLVKKRKVKRLGSARKM